jgi:hypothetical protein
MTHWPADDLATIADTDDLHIAPLRSDGTTYGTPTWIWSVVVGPELFVRAYSGTASRWYQAARSQKAGRITAGGRQLDVDFEVLEKAGGGFPDEAIDAAYRTKYASSPYLGHMISDLAKAATAEFVKVIGASGS